MNYAEFLYILEKDGMNRSKLSPEGGTTMSEVLVAVVLLAVFFGSIFELNAVCLRYIDASKESIAALQLVNDRSETLRNLAFSDLTNSSYVQNLLSSPANGSEFAKKATEVVKISAYPTANGVTQFTRSANGTVTTDLVATDLGSTLVQVNVGVSWMMSLGTRARSEQVTSIISNGTKK
jgi:Tfp pilus assembly protein PilV